jgi:hypothetical protein
MSCAANRFERASNRTREKIPRFCMKGLQRVMSGCNASWKGEDTPRVYPYPGCCLFFHEDLSSGNVSWLTTLFTDRPSHPKRTMAYLRSSSITVAGPPGNHTPFRFSRSSAVIVEEEQRQVKGAMC